MGTVERKNKGNIRSLFRKSETGYVESRPLALFWGIQASSGFIAIRAPNLQSKGFRILIYLVTKGSVLDLAKAKTLIITLAKNSEYLLRARHCTKPFALISLMILILTSRGRSCHVQK